MNSADCETAFYLEVALAEQAAWAETADTAASAAACFDREEAQLTRQIDSLRETPIAPDRRDRQVARRETQLAANSRMRAQSWFNGAVSNFNLARKDDARRLAQKVADDERFGARARALLERLAP